MTLIEKLKDKKIFGCFDSDLDGVGSRVIAEYYLNPVCRMVYLNTGKRDMSEYDINIALSADICLFVDIAPTLELYEELEKNNKIIIICDHHQSSRDELGERENYYFDLFRCGCKLFYDELTIGMRKNRVAERFVELVNTYDLWKDDTENWGKAKDLHNALYGSIDWYQTDTEKYLDFVIDQLDKFRNSKEFHFTYKEKVSIDKANKKEISNLKEAKRTLRIRKDNKGNNYGFFTCSSKLSITANRLLKEYGDKLDYVVGHITWNEKQQIKEDKLKLSLRSNNFDIRHIAEKHSGGGHKLAAGLEVSYKDFNDFKEGKIHLI